MWALVGVNNKTIQDARDHYPATSLPGRHFLGLRHSRSYAVPDTKNEVFFTTVYSLPYPNRGALFSGLQDL